MIIRIKVVRVEEGGAVTLEAHICNDQGAELWSLAPGTLSRSDCYDVLLPGIDSTSLVTVS